MTTYDDLTDGRRLTFSRHRRLPDSVPTGSEALQALRRRRLDSLARLRRRCVLADGAAALLVGVVLLLGGRPAGVATTLVLAAAVAARTYAAASYRSVLAVRTPAKPLLVLTAAACGVLLLRGWTGSGAEVLLAAASFGVAVLAVRLVARAALTRSGTYRRTPYRLLVGDPQALDLDPDRRSRLVASGDVELVVTRAERPGADQDRGPDRRADQRGVDAPRAGAPAGVVERVARAALVSDAERVTVIPGETWRPPQLRELSWLLEDTGVELVVATNLVGIAPHRVDVVRQDGRLSIRIGSARPGGARAVAKAALDRLFAAILLVLASPVLLAIGLLVQWTSPGPAFFSQIRIGEHGREFRMWKFRSMVVDAEARLDDLREHNDHGPTPGLFKMAEDPRVTRVGRVLRRLSLDELPQLINVAQGQMSLIGPRPALPAEVATYDFAARRRLAVKPGMTGLWQVSGRSSLSWDESIGLDLDYVDNWSAVTDAAIAVRTIRAVVSSDGAY